MRVHVDLTLSAWTLAMPERQSWPNVRAKALRSSRRYRDSGAVRGEAVPQRVHGDVLVEHGVGGCRVAGPVELAGRDRLSGFAAGKQPAAWPLHAARYFRPGAQPRSRATSSGLSTTGSRSGDGTVAS